MPWGFKKRIIIKNPARTETNIILNTGGIEIFFPFGNAICLLLSSGSFNNGKMQKVVRKELISPAMAKTENCLKMGKGVKRMEKKPIVEVIKHIKRLLEI